MRDWRLASPWGILRSGEPDDPNAGFNAGHVNDVLRLNTPIGTPLLAASATSGVWWVDESGLPAKPLSTKWKQLGVNCLTVGFRSPLHVYAAGDALYETDTNQPDPLNSWQPIMLVDADTGNAAAVGEIFRMIVLLQGTALVLATASGVWWGHIPAAPGGAYTVQRVADLPGKRYSSVAEGPDGRVLVACWGSDLASAYGIFIGHWSGPGGGLQFTNRATVLGVPEQQMLRTELAACAKDRKHLYAVCGGAGVTPKLDAVGKHIPDGQGGIEWNGDDFILAVIHSQDGGMTWTKTGNAVTGETLRLFPGGPGKDLAGHTQWGYNLCIGVSPFDPTAVAVGVGGAFRSIDGGANWEHFSPNTSPHRHTDTHACVFDTINPTTLHICSDGGIATTPDLGATWLSAANRQLPNLQIARHAVSSKDEADGLLAGSLQDNGDLYTPLYPQTSPWLTPPEAEGDGRLSMFVSTGHLVHNTNTTSLDMPRASNWHEAENRFLDVTSLPLSSGGVIPVDGTSNGLVSTPDPEYQNAIEPVVSVDGKNAAGEFMQAVAAEGETVYGLYMRANRTFHWQVLASVPHKPDIIAGPTPGTTQEQPYYATASASLDGHSVVVGMNNGRLYRLDEPGWTATDISAPAISDPITRIAVAAHDNIFAIAQDRAFRWDGATWHLLPRGTPTTLPTGSPFVALAIDLTSSPPNIFVATAGGVWTSSDNGATWATDTIGLPAMANCTDLRTVNQSGGAAFIYLSTYGWSVFRRLINFSEFTRILTVSGHMDIVDRTVTGHDLWAHPAITRLAQLGPLQPLAKWTITEDDGDEVRVVLKLRADWKTDDSIHLTYHAELISKDEDNAVSDHTDGTRIITFGGTETVVIDLVSDELWPDRAHIEFGITNI